MLKIISLLTHRVLCRTVSVRCCVNISSYSSLRFFWTFVHLGFFRDRWGAAANILFFLKKCIFVSVNWWVAKQVRHWKSETCILRHGMDEWQCITLNGEENVSSLLFWVFQPDVFTMKDMQDQLRSLLPNINISFGSPPHLSTSQPPPPPPGVSPPQPGVYADPVLG